MSTMNSNSMSSGSNDNSRYMNPSNEATVRCHCGFQLNVQTSWTKKNPGRQFMSCPQRGANKCGFFRWCEPPFAERSKDIISGLIENLDTVRAELALSKLREERLMRMTKYSWITTFVILVFAYFDRKFRCS